MSGVNPAELISVDVIFSMQQCIRRLHYMLSVCHSDASAKNGSS